MEQQNNKTTRQQLNYKNGKIYKIKSPKGDLVYIGSTTQQYLSQRYAQHIASYSSYKNYGGNKGTTSAIVFDAYGIENCSIELIENYPCESRQALDNREFFFINSIPCVNYRKNNKENPLSLMCVYCPLFSCKLKSDYNRHIATVSHISNEKLIKQLETIKQQETTKQQVSRTSQQDPAESKDRLIERKLCLNREFLHRAFFPVHVYRTRELFVDIRDRYSPSRDKEISYLNCDFFHTSVY